LAARANYLVGDREMWRAMCRCMGAIRYRELYRGIDLAYGRRGKLKSEFVVRPGGNPGAIRLAYDRAVRVEDDGRLADCDRRPGAARRTARVVSGNGRAAGGGDGAFAIYADGSVGFRVGEYDRTRTLVIDPVLTYSTLLGGSGFDTATSIAVSALARRTWRASRIRRICRR